MKPCKFIALALTTFFSTSCQVISPIFVDYNGVRMDVARWINNQQLLTLQQKRSLVQLSKAQQNLYRIEQIPEDQKLAVATQNQIALHCAFLHLTENKIGQLQSIVFGQNRKHEILQYYERQFPQVKLAASAIQCE
ncbi:MULTISPECIES: hypothetical protein [unclassified Acinetobacter]|uniref:hypothetical protein n=1 Tax=unclassified Acinetobacter TaxID=196816 RepID=UPI001210BAEE|nr:MULTISPECIES: hypothetical protein [unclassified Acinetobacter]RZJ23371.1 MAG: hypothetical protein EON51_03935 [Acinetobacter sp.]